jgi:hypothetical protein
MDPVPDPLLLRKSGSAGNRTRTSGSLARNSDHKTTEAVNTHCRWDRKNKTKGNENVYMVLSDEMNRSERK